ncbi:MAG: tetratricopeptide repeat protein, partial [Calditrichia bacterium]
LGLTYDNLAKLPEAEQCYRRCLEIDPQYHIAYNNWGFIFHQQKQYGHAIEKYRKAIEVKPDYETAYSNWIKALVLLNANPEDLQEIDRKIKENFNTATGLYYLGNLYFDLRQYPKSADAYSLAVEKDPENSLYIYFLGLSYHNQFIYDEAIAHYRKALEKKPDYSEVYFDWGNALLDTFRYEEALEKFRKAASLKEDYAYALHNIAFLLEKQGHYKLARKEWRVALNAYRKTAGTAREQNNAMHFLYQGNIHFFIFDELQEGEDSYEEGLKIEPENTSIMSNLVQLHLKSKNKSDYAAAEQYELQTNSHWKALRYFRKAEELLKKKLEQKEEAVYLFELGKLYRVMEDYSQAAEYLQKTIEKDNFYYDAHAELGAVHMKQEDFKKAISSFKQAIQLDPDNLGFRSNLGEAYCKSGFRNQAENEYRRILEITPCHMDSLIGMGEVYSSMGEDAKKRHDSGSAEEMLSQAVSYYADALKWAQQDQENASKFLNAAELSAVYYALGYAKVQLFEVQRRKSNDLLQDALSDFTQVKKGTPNYFKARRAIKKLNDRLFPHQDFTVRWGPRIIFAIALIVFLLAQFAFFVGKPVITQSTYLIDASNIEELPAGLMPDSLQENLAGLQGRSYGSRQEFRSALMLAVGPRYLNRLDSLAFVGECKQVQLRGFDPIDATFYGLLTFGALIFMVAGLYLQEITRLKFGTIELEKSSVDQITTSSTLGITK